jgi:DUF4097 and DUF4098 domain-containing protein YvlB
MNPRLMMRTLTLAPFLLATLFLAAAPLEAQGRRGDGDVRQRIDTTFAFDRGGEVDLSLVSGEIIVTGGASNQIRIVATTERGRLVTSFGRTHVSIEARSVDNRLGDTRYELTVPRGTRVTAHAVSGDIRVHGTGAAVEVHSVSGDISVRDASDRLEVGTVSGDLTVARASGRLQFESVSGDMMAEELTGDLTIETISGEMTLRRSTLAGIRASSMSGDLEYDGPFSPTGTYRFNSHSGNVEFGLPANAGATLQLETFSGRIASDFPLTLQPGQTAGRRNRRMEFTLGTGGTRISAETFSGNITIRRLPARGNQE